MLPSERDECFYGVWGRLHTAVDPVEFEELCKIIGSKRIEINQVRTIIFHFKRFHSTEWI